VGVVRGWYEAVLSDLSLVTTTERPWTLYLLFGLVVGNYLATPLGWDQQINVAFAQQAQTIGEFPDNIVNAWTVRGIGYKLVVFVAYAIAESSVGYVNKPLFEFVYRIEMLVMYAGTLAVAVYLCRSRLESKGYDTASVYFLVTAAFLTLSHWVAFQADDVAALVTILAVALALSEYSGSSLAAGIVFSLLVTFKGITVLFVPLGFLLMLAFEGRYRVYYPWLLVSTVLCGIFVSVCLIVFVPRTVLDIVEATQLQSTFSVTLIDRLRSVLAIGAHFQHLPILVSGGFAGAGLLVTELRSKNGYRVTLLTALAVVPVIYIAIQAKGFGYHFVAFLPTAIGVYFWAGAYERSNDGPRYSSLLVIAFLVVATLTVSPVGFFDGSAADERRADVGSQIDVYSDIRETTGITESTTVLYLADGTATYYLGAESHLRYYYPLSVQRAQHNDRLRDTRLYERTHQRALSYQGDYVVMTEWFELGAFPELQEKLQRDYCVVFRGSPRGPYENDVVVYEQRPATC